MSWIYFLFSIFKNFVCIVFQMKLSEGVCEQTRVNNSCLCSSSQSSTVQTPTVKGDEWRTETRRKTHSVHCSFWFLMELYSACRCKKRMDSVVRQMRLIQTPISRLHLETCDNRGIVAFWKRKRLNSINIDVLPMTPGYSLSGPHSSNNASVSLTVDRCNNVPPPSGQLVRQQANQLATN